MKIAIADRNAAGLVTTSNLIKQTGQNVDVLSVTTDVQHEDQVQQLIDNTVEHFGRIDYALNGAGILSNSEHLDEQKASQGMC